MNLSIKAKLKRKNAHIKVDINIRGRRLILAMRKGPNSDVAKLIQPAPKLAHSAA